MGDTDTRTLEPGLDEPTIDIERMEIFRAGDYGEKGRFGEKELGDIAEAYDPAKHEAPQTLDHAKAGPAYGWVKKVWREGASLFASVRNVPQSLAAAIKNGRYGKRSVEIYRPGTVGETPYLRAVSILGAQVPEVKGMAPIPASFAEATAFAEYEFPGGDEAKREEDQRTTEKARSEFAVRSPPATKDLPPAPASPSGEVYRMAEGYMIQLEDLSPGGHGVLAKAAYTTSMLDHSHDAYMDAENNGFTTRADDGHFHLITKGEIAPAGDVEHAHKIDFVRYSEMKKAERFSANSNKEKEERGMSEDKAKDKKTETPKAEALKNDPNKFSEELAAVKATAETQKVEIEKLRKEADAARAEARDTRENARFSEVMNKARGEGRVPAVEVPFWKALFHALPHDENANVIEFGEGEEKKSWKPRELTLAHIATRPQLEIYRESLNTADSIAEGQKGAKGPNSDEAIFTEAKKIEKTLVDEFGYKPGEETYREAVKQATEKLGASG